MLKRIVLLVFIFGLFFPSVSHAETGHVVINAFQISGERATDEFIEIYNPTNSSINVTGWRLSKKTATGTLSNLLTTFPEKTLAPGERVIIGHKDSLAAKDFTYSTSSSLAVDNTILLFSDAGKTIVDLVGMGKASIFEGQPAGNPVPLEILSRDNGEDTDNNFEDFYSSSEEGPGNEDTTLNDVFFDLSITELMPNPEGSDSENEWIEVYNNGARVDLGGLVLRDKLGSPKQYKIPLGTFINARSYLVFYSKVTKISLNNDGDIVELVDPFGAVIDSSEINYEKSLEGISFALFGDTWDWSAKPTPGAKNSFVAPKIEQKKKSSKKKTKKKKTKKKRGDVLGSFSGEDDPEELEAEETKVTMAEKKLGYGLLGVALLAATLYTLYVNREKVSEAFNKLRKRYETFGAKVRSKLEEK